MKQTDFVTQLREAVTAFASFEADHSARRAAMLRQYVDLEGSSYHSATLAKHDQELVDARNAATEKIAAIAAEFERFVARGYMVDASFLHGDKDILPIMSHSELLGMAKKHNGNTTMQRLISATCEQKGLSASPIVPREHRQEGFDFVAKMARAAVNDSTTPTRAVFTDDAVWPTAWTSHKEAADVSDFAQHFDRYDSAHSLKIPPQFPAE